MELTITTPAGNTCFLWQMEWNTKTQNKLCIGNINSYYNPTYNTLNNNGRSCWFEPELLSEVIKKYDNFCGLQKRTPPTTLIQGL